MTDHRAWAKMLAEKALARFGARVWFMGLQGSVRRGAATESSDIDFVLILDRLDTADLSAYRELVRSMPDSEKACGFVSGRKEPVSYTHLASVPQGMYPSQPPGRCGLSQALHTGRPYAVCRTGYAPPVPHPPLP